MFAAGMAGWAIDHALRAGVSPEAQQWLERASVDLQEIQRLIAAWSGYQYRRG